MNVKVKVTSKREEVYSRRASARRRVEGVCVAYSYTLQGKRGCSHHNSRSLFLRPESSTGVIRREKIKAPKLDLVQFPKAVQVNEVRVIPLGARVKADFPGGVRLGATNPSRFEIDFFVNDLGKRGAATFENVGQLLYDQQGPIKLDFDKAPPTDGLLLRGAYNTITLAVYGTISKLNRDAQSTPPPPPIPQSPPLQQNATPIPRDRVSSPARSPRSTPAPTKRDGGVVVNPPSLPHAHPLPEKVNPNERIRNWLQDTQIPHSPLDLDCSPTKVWDDPPYDSDLAAGPGLAGKDGLTSPQSREFSLHRSPVHSRPHSPPASPRTPPPSPPHSPSPQQQQQQQPPQQQPQQQQSRSTRSSRLRSRERSRHRSQEQVASAAPAPTSQERSHDRVPAHERLGERVHDKSHERSHERSHDRSHERSHERSHDRGGHERSHDRGGASHERSRERSDHDTGDRSVKYSSSRDRSSRQRSRERSREQSEHRSVSLARSHNADLWEKEYPDARESCREYSGSREGSGKEKRDKRGRERRRSREEKRDKRKSLEEYEESGDGNRRGRYNSPESGHECGPRTPPPPLPPPPATRRGWRGDEQEGGGVPADDVGPSDEVEPPISGNKRRRLDRNRDLGDDAGVGGDLDDTAAPGPAAAPEGGSGALLFGDDMEAISDDEDLPDLPPEGDTPSIAVTQQGEAVDEGAPVPDRPPVSAPPTGGAEFDFEEIMSDEEELPEYQEFEEEGVEEEYIVEEWEDWLKPFSLLEFQCVAPAVKLVSPALTPFQAGVLLGGEKAEDESASKLLLWVEGCCLPSAASSDEDREAFVHSCEQVTAVVPSSLHLLSQDKLKGCVSTLCDWADVGLDMEEAMAQAQPIYKIRHLKAGLRLVVCLLQCNDDVTQLLLSRLPLMHRLHHLYHLPYMAQSTKLLILRTMDSILSCGAGVQQFMAFQPKMELTGYEVLLQLLADTTHTRAKVAASAILRKLHLLEAMEKLRDDITGLQALLPPPPPLLHSTMEGVEEATLGCEMTAKEGSVGPSPSFMAAGAVDEEVEAMETDGVLVAGGGPADDWCAEDIEAGTGVVGEEEDVDDDDVLGERDGAGGLGITVPRQLITSITSCLKNILHTFRHAEHLLSQPHRYFPVSKQFQVRSCPYDVMQEVFTLLDHGGLMGSLASLFTCLSYGLQLEPLDAAPPLECLWSREPPLLSVSALLVQLLRTVAESMRGLSYLAAHHAETTLLLRGLLKCVGEDRPVGSEYSCSDVISDGVTNDPLSDPCLDLQDCSVQLLERLHVHQQLDSLALIAANTSPLDLTQAVVHLNALVGMLLTHHSKMSLVTTLATGDYMEHLYPYLTLLQPNDTADNAPLKLACFGYTVELLTVTVRLSGDMRFMEKHADKLCAMIEAEETREGPTLDESLKLLELMPWLSVARKSETLSYDTIPHLVDVVKDQLEHVDKFPGELFTVLRVLRSLAIPRYAAAPQQPNEENNGDVFQELKYKYAVLQLFYADLTSHLNSLLTKLCALFPQPALHTSQLSGTEGACLVNLLQPALALLYCLLQQVIQARGAAYHDLSSVQPLLSTYLLVSAFPSSSPHRPAASQLQRKVLQMFLLYTQPGHHPDTPCNSNSLWVQMLAQIIKFCEHLPHTMVPGLCLLTELLPLPLPVVGRQLTKEELERCVVVRKLWAANLSPLAESLYRLLHRIAPASQPALTHALRRACIALADLAPQMVVVIVRPLLDLALQTQRADAATTAVSAPVNTSASNSMSRIVYMLASLSSHSGCKAAILHLFTTEPYNVLLPAWCSAVTQGLEGDTVTTAQTLRQHHAPLCLLMHHLCNTHNNMQGKLESSLWGVPCRELLSPMLECLVAMLSSTTIEHRVLHPLLTTLNDTITHDYGLFHLKSVMDKRKGCLHALLQRLATDIPSSKSGMDAVPTLQGLLELCHGLLSPENVPPLVISKPCDGSKASVSGLAAPELIPLRTMSVSPAELCVYVSWELSVTAPSSTKFELEKGCVEKSTDDVSKSAADGVDDSQPSNEDKTVKLEELSAAAREESTPAETTPVEGVAAALGGVVPVLTGNNTEADTRIKVDIAQGTKMALGVHPLRVLEHVIADVYCSEAVIEQMYSEVTELIAVMESAATDPHGLVLNKVSDAWESSSSGDSCAGVGGGSISQQYEERLICCPSSGNEEPTALWLQQPSALYGSGDSSVGAAAAGPGTDSVPGQDTGPDMVAVSLGQLLRECGAGDYDLDASAQKVLRGHQAGGSPQKPAALAKGPAKFKSNPVPLRPGSRGMRPFGFATRGMNLRTDPFRCRPPNTSRPPSLHVDDFVALESTGHQPTGPTGYNRISFGRGKMLLDSMRGGRGGRGMMGRGTSSDARGGPMTGGRFMYRPPMYRPDFNNRGMMNRGMRWNFRGNDGGGMMRGGGGGPMGMNGGGQYRPQGPGPMSGMRFMRGRGMFTRGSPGGYNDRGMRHMRGGFH